MKVTMPSHSLISKPDTAANSVMKAWLAQRLSNATPNEREAAHLSLRSGLTIDRVTQWCCKFRLRKSLMDEVYSFEFRASGEASQLLGPIFLKDGEACVQMVRNDENFLPMKLQLLNRRTIASLLKSKRHKQQACSDPEVFQMVQCVISQFIRKPAKPWSKRLKALFGPWRELFRQNQDAGKQSRPALDRSARSRKSKPAEKLCDEANSEPSYGYEEDNESSVRKRLAVILQSEAMSRLTSFERLDLCQHGDTTGDENDGTEMRDRLRAVMKSEQIKRRFASLARSVDDMPPRTGVKILLRTRTSHATSNRERPHLLNDRYKQKTDRKRSFPDDLTSDKESGDEATETSSGETNRPNVQSKRIKSWRPTSITECSSIVSRELPTSCESGIGPSSYPSCASTIKLPATGTFYRNSLTIDQFASGFPPSNIPSNTPFYPPLVALKAVVGPRSHNAHIILNEMDPSSSCGEKNTMKDSNNLPSLAELDLPNPSIILRAEQPYMAHTQVGFC